MALPFEVEKVEEIPEELRPLYVEKEGKFRLDVTGIDPADELKKALAAEREQSKSAKARLAEAERLKEEAERKKLEENKQYEELWKKERDEKKKIADEYQAEKRRSFVDLNILQLTKDPERARILQREMLDNVAVVDGKITIPGLPGIETAEQLVAHYREKFPFLIDGNKSTGGGAPGGNGGKPTVDYSKMTPIERLTAARSK